MNTIIGGIFAGVAQSVSGHPFDTVKIVSIDKNLTPYNSYKHIVKTNYFNLYRGIASPITSSIIMNIKTFYIYEHFKIQHGYFGAGGITGIILSLIECPFDFVKTKMQTSSNRLKYANVICKYNVKLYRGLTATIVRNYFSVGLFFFGYEHTKNFISNPILGSLTGGFVAGFLCWAPTYPLDNIKTRIQTDHDKNIRNIFRDITKSSTTRSTFKEIVKKLFKGFTPCVARAMFVNPFVFLAYELGSGKIIQF